MSSGCCCSSWCTVSSTLGQGTTGTQKPGGVPCGFCTWTSLISSVWASAQAGFADPSKVVTDEKKCEQARRQSDPYGERLDHARTLAAIVVQVIERGAEAEHNEQQRDDDNNANQVQLAGSNQW